MFFIQVIIDGRNFHIIQPVERSIILNFYYWSKSEILPKVFLSILQMETAITIALFLL